MSTSVATYDADLTRAAALLATDSSGTAAKEAILLARACVSVDATRVNAHVVLARALVQCRQSDEAVRVCKTALAQHPGNAMLEDALRNARFAVLSEIEEEEEEEEEEGQEMRCGEENVRGFRGTAQAATDTSQLPQEEHKPSRFSTAFNGSVPQSDTEVSRGGVSDIIAFEAKVERLMVHLDVQKLLRVGVWYTLLEMLQFRTVTAGFVSLFFGLLAQAAMHHQKLMVVSMVVVGLAHSKLLGSAEKYLQRWVHTSTDKLGSFVWLPRVSFALPVVLKILGQLRFVLFLRRDWALSLVVTFAAGAFVFAAASVRSEAHPLKQWGYGKRLKFVAYTTAIVYWALWRGNYADTFRLLGPALMDAGGILLSSVSSEEIQGVLRRAWKRVFDEVASDVQQDVDFDAWFLMGLTSWGIDYWQQPTNLSLEMLSKGLSDAFASFENHAVTMFRPELHRLGQQIRHMGDNSEFGLLVAYLKQSLESVPPRKWLGLLGLVSKRCSSFLVALLLLVFFGTLPPPLVPFLVAEAADARALCGLYGSEELKPMDGLDVLLLGSPLARVWGNAKAAVYCLEGGVTFSTAMATGARIATTAVRLGQLASFAAKVRASGLAAHADEIPDHVTNAFIAVGKIGGIAEGVRHLFESTHVQDFGGHIKRWWSRDKQA